MQSSYSSIVIRIEHGNPLYVHMLINFADRHRIRYKVEHNRNRYAPLVKEEVIDLTGAEEPGQAEPGAAQVLTNNGLIVAGRLSPPCPLPSFNGGFVTSTPLKRPNGVHNFPALQASNSRKRRFMQSPWNHSAEFRETRPNGVHNFPTLQASNSRKRRFLQSPWSQSAEFRETNHLEYTPKKRRFACQFNLCRSSLDVTNLSKHVKLHCRRLSHMSYEQIWVQCFPELPVHL
ncbi:hypothetical protein Q1695_015833 [Nippostrongylus brasiliensis]|nr:hypothetical protein Q1695_015833 [Nippostrongylus brasiliensis]